MKDIYELLNEIDINENEMDEMKVSEFEKKRVKTQFKKSINKKRRLKKSAIIAAAISIIVVGGTVTLGIANPTYAATIPVVGDIFRSLDNGRTGVYDKYKENANEINVTKESNGVSITIIDAIFDGKTLSYTYEIKSDKDLGEEPLMRSAGGEPILRMQNYDGAYGGSKGTQIKKVSDNTYIGQTNSSISKETDEINFKLNISHIDNRDEKVVEGNWNFDINLKAIASTNQVVKQSTQKESAKVTIDSITKTNASFTVNFSDVLTKEMTEKWFSSYLYVEVRDDLGNIYKGQENGGTGGKANYSGSGTFGKINENATKLIITPKMDLANTGEEYKIDSNGNKTLERKAVIDADHPEKGQIIFDDIVVDLEK